MGVLKWLDLYAPTVVSRWLFLGDSPQLWETLKGHSQQLEQHSFLRGGHGGCISTPSVPSEILWGSRPACWGRHVLSLVPRRIITHLGDSDVRHLWWKVTDVAQLGV